MLVLLSATTLASVLLLVAACLRVCHDVCRYVRLDGSVSRVQRMISISQFNKPGSKVRLLSLVTVVLFRTCSYCSVLYWTLPNYTGRDRTVLCCTVLCC
jgi:hypothetical protein